MNPLFWYPPAETKIPLKAFCQSLGSADDMDPEQAINKATGSIFCRFGPSGRVLLYNLLKNLKQESSGRRKEVLIPGYTCYSVAAAVVKAGLKIRLYDLDPKTLAPDYQSMEANFSERTLAVVSQHLFGIPTDLNPVAGIAASLGAYHIEDAAQAFGGGQSCFTAIDMCGDFGLFSFGRGKPLPLGGGGALVSIRYDLNQIMPPFKVIRSWSPIAISTMTQIVAQPTLYGFAEMLPLGLGETIFDPDFKSGPVTSFFRKLLIPMLSYLPELNTHRIFIASIYRNRLAPHHLVTIGEGKNPIYHRFPVLVKNNQPPIGLRRLGVRRLYPNALHREPEIAAHTVNSNQNFSGAETLAQQLATLPTHHAINEKLAETIAASIHQWAA